MLEVLCGEWSSLSLIFEVVGVLGNLRLSVAFVVVGLRGSGCEGPAAASFMDLLPVDCIESDGVRLWDFVGRGAILWELEGIEEQTIDKFEALLVNDKISRV